MRECFPKPKSSFATKADLKMQQVVTHRILLKIDLAKWKLDVGKLDVDKLKNVLSNLGNLKSKLDENN